MAEAGADVQAKYVKLLKAYSELKQKNSVLKKTVQELNKEKEEKPPNQDAGNNEKIQKLLQERAKLQAAMQDKDQRIRAGVAEMDTLRFRNEQLTKRVEVMQEEANAKDKGAASGLFSGMASAVVGGSSRKRADAAADALVLQEEELRRKIKENEKLHRDSAEQRRKYDAKLKELKKSLKSAQDQLVEKEQHGTKVKSESATSIQRLELVNQQLDDKLSGLEAELMGVKEALARKENEYNSLEERSSSAISNLQEIYATKNFFDDTKYKEFNALNVPVAPDKAAGKTKQILTEISQHLRSFVVSFSNFLSYIEERMERIQLPGGLSAIAMETISALRDHSTYIKPLDRTFSMFVDETVALGPFQGALSNFENYMGRLLPLLETCLDEENKLADCTTLLLAANSGISSAWGNIVKEVRNINKYLTTFIGETGGSAQKQLNGILFGLERVSAHHVALASNFGSKISLEQQLARSTDKSRSTDSMINQVLGKLVTNFESLTKLLQDNLGSISVGGTYAVRGVPMSPEQSKSVEVESLKDRAKAFMRSLTCDAPDSVPYQDALALSRDVHLGPNKNSLDTGLSSNPDVAARISALEQEREHYILELELLKMKNDRLESVNSSSLSSPEKSVSQPIKTQMPMEAVPKSANGDIDLMRQHFEDRIRTLMTQLQFADGKAVAYYDECRSIALRYEKLRHTQAKQGEEYKNVNDTISELKEDLESTKRNYEEQLSAMTEHVMAMNDQLQQKDNDIDTLKRMIHQGGKSGSSRTKQSSRKQTKEKDVSDVPNFSKFG
eukprot:m.21015 g.21015  ORF g.21015 m.21015 type:complete len:788 (+) comp7011_c0_seq1:115-2478(+)